MKKGWGVIDKGGTWFRVYKSKSYAQKIATKKNISEPWRKASVFKYKQGMTHHIKGLSRI
jgi:hypothetical protein